MLVSTTNLSGTVHISGRTAIVTGSSQGWGLGIAKAFAERGVDVAVTGSTQARVEAAVEQVNMVAAGQVVGITADLGNRDGCARLFAEATRALGTIDILVNNAGKVEQATILETTAEQWHNVINLSLHAQFYLTQMVARALVAAGRGGRIINMAGGAGFSGLVGHANHAAAKGGGMGAVLTWARELRPHGITVNALAGLIATAQGRPFIDRVHQDRAARGLPPRSDKEVGFYPPEELAAVAVWLASESAATVSGRMLHASGAELQIWRMASIEKIIHNSVSSWTPELLDDIGLAEMLTIDSGVEERRLVRHSTA